MSVETAAGATNIPLHTGGEISWDELFPAGDTPVAQGATTPQGGTPAPAAPVPPPQPAAAAPAAPVITTKTGTVYKTVDEAIKGIEHKDTVIADMRSRMILATGIDPLTGQPALPQSTVQQPKNYLQDDGTAFYTDLVAAANKNDAKGVFNAQTKLIFDALAPLAPVMNSFAKQQAVQQLSAELPDAKEFIGSENYTKALDETPELKQAIAAAESDFQHHSRLPGLYKVAYRISQGLRLPEILKAQPQQPSQPVRQTTAASTLTPTDSHSAQPSMRTKEGRAALRAQLEAKGVADMPLF